MGNILALMRRKSFFFLSAFGVKLLSFQRVLYSLDRECGWEASEPITEKYSHVLEDLNWNSSLGYVEVIAFIVPSKMKAKAPRVNSLFCDALCNMQKFSYRTKNCVEMGRRKKLLKFHVMFITKAPLESILPWTTAQINRLAESEDGTGKFIMSSSDFALR